MMNDQDYLRIFNSACTWKWWRDLDNSLKHKLVADILAFLHEQGRPGNSDNVIEGIRKIHQAWLEDGSPDFNSWLQKKGA